MGGTQIMEVMVIVGHEEQSEMDFLGDGEAVELVENRDDVVTGPRVSKWTSSRVLDML